MRDGLVPENMAIETADAVRYELPSWPAGQSRRIGLLRALGIVFALSGLLFTVPLIMTWDQGPAREPAIHWLLGLACPFYLAALISLIYAQRGAPSRDTIEVTVSGIAVTSQAGPWRRSRQVRWADVARLTLTPAWNVPGYGAIEGSFLLRLIRLRGGPLLLAGDEDRARLLVLAHELARRAKVARAAAADIPVLPPVEVVEENSLDLVSDRYEQPPGSTATLEQHADGVTITVPALGLHALVQQPALLMLALLLAASFTWITATVVPAAARAGLSGVFARDPSMIAWPVALVFTPVLAHLLSRRAELSSRGGVLTVQWSFLIFGRSRAWRREDLAEIRAVSELVTSDGQKTWTKYLAIRPYDGSVSGPRHLLYWCEKPELEWIATTLRHSLPLSEMLPARE
jgi:hypothetical protein